MSPSLDFLRIQLNIALGGGMFFSCQPETKHLPDSWGQRRIIDIFASGGHFPLYFLSRMIGFDDILPPAVSQCILAFGGRMFFMLT